MTTTTTIEKLNNMRAQASKLMGFPCYRGQDWFVRESVKWLSNICPELAIRFHNDYWWVTGLGQAGYWVVFDNSATMEEALCRAVLAV